MKNLIYILLFLTVVISIYYIYFNKKDKVELTMFTTERFDNLTDNASKFILDVKDKSLNMAKDGYTYIVTQLEVDNSTLSKDNSSDNSSKKTTQKAKADNTSVVEPTPVADNETILNLIDSVVNSVIDNATKTINILSEYIKTHLGEVNAPIDKKVGDNFSADDITLDNTTAK